jgi:hypothetical protein
MHTDVTHEAMLGAACNIETSGDSRERQRKRDVGRKEMVVRVKRGEVAYDWSYDGTGRGLTVGSHDRLMIAFVKLRL